MNQKNHALLYIPSPKSSNLAQLFTKSVLHSSYYTIIAPYAMRAARKYLLIVSIHRAKEPCKIKLDIVGFNYNDSQTVEIQVNELKMVEFDVPANVKGDYVLKAQGLYGIVFEIAARIKAEIIQPAIAIQTDKGAYNPGDVVDYRVLFLDENLKSAQPNAEVYIRFVDGKNNRVKEIKDFKVIKGVHTGKFQISEYPVLGDWQLEVDNGEESHYAVDFRVEKYVLPKYEVQVEATQRVSIKDGHMQVVVKANYTYGKPVNAKVTLIMELSQGYYFSSSAESFAEVDEGSIPKLIKTADMLNGVATIDLNLMEYAVHLNKHTVSYLSIKAIVEEQFTGVKMEESAYSTLYPYRYEMRCLSYDTAAFFHANQQADVKVEVKHVNGTLVTDASLVLSLIYTETIREQNYWNTTPKVSQEPAPQIATKTLTFESHLNETGCAIFKVTLPELEKFQNYEHFFKVEMQCDDERHNLLRAYQRETEQSRTTVSPAAEKAEDYFRIDIDYGNDDQIGKIDENLKVKISSGLPLNYFDYIIVARGQILICARIELNEPAKEYELTVLPTFAMAHKSYIYAFYVNNHGEFIYKDVFMSIELEFPNQLVISAPEEAKPGEEIRLHIKTAPNSFVGILAVDQSVLLLGENNDVTDDELRQCLDLFDPYIPWKRRIGPASSTGLITLTNAQYAKDLEVVDSSALRMIAYSAAEGPIGFLVKMADNEEQNPGSESEITEVVVRKEFAETWIFDNIENTESKEFTLVKKIPDTITSWILNAFAISPEKGIGILREKINIRTFQPFFITIRLPYSVKRGEVINVPALIFNYLAQELNVVVTLDNSDAEYDFLDASAETLKTTKLSKSLSVSANSSNGVSFLLRPKIVGNIMLKFLAISPKASDAIHKTLKVVPEGVTQYANRAYFVNLHDETEFKESFKLVLPEEFVPDSQFVEFSVIGDLLGPMLKNIDHLVRAPTGCCEQTTSMLVPNYLVLRYLKSTGKLVSALESKIISNLESGYQHLLSYRLDDGSFCSFLPTKSDADEEAEEHTGSTWLTAYVIRSLYNAKQYIAIDDELFAKGLAYLASQQTDDGSFKESKDFYYYAYRKPLALAASVVLTFAEIVHFTETRDAIVDKAVHYILKNLPECSDLHVQTLATYALHKTRHATATQLLSDLKHLAQNDSDRQWWTEREEKTKHDWWLRCFSHDVEITAYMLLALLDTAPIESVLPIVKWLIAQRDSYGGFSSTQDTVVGLQALIKFAEKSKYEAGLMSIEFKAKGVVDKHDVIAITEENGLLLQSVELPPETNVVDFKAQGKGTALVQISYQYNIFVKEQQPSFTIESIIKSDTPPGKLEMYVCIEYSNEEERSNMVLLEISLPSGYVADANSFQNIAAVSGVRLIETKNSESIIVVYFETLKKNELKTLPIIAFKSFAVALQKPAPIVLYDYYDTAKRATHYYEVITALSDICEKDI